MPGTDELSEGICYARHAPALDECRVKFLPEFFFRCSSSETKKAGPETDEPQCKEVWFRGYHSDM